MRVLDTVTRPGGIIALTMLSLGTLIGVSCIHKESEDKKEVRRKQDELTDRILYLVKDLDQVVEVDVAKAVKSKDPDLRTSCRDAQGSIKKIEMHLSGQKDVPQAQPLTIPETSAERQELILTCFARIKVLRGEMVIAQAQGYRGRMPEVLLDMRVQLRTIERALGFEGLPEYNVEKMLKMLKLINELKSQHKKSSP